MSIEFRKTRLGVNVATDSQDNEYIFCDDNKTVYINGKEFLLEDLAKVLLWLVDVVD